MDIVKICPKCRKVYMSKEISHCDKCSVQLVFHPKDNLNGNRVLIILVTIVSVLILAVIVLIFFLLLNSKQKTYSPESQLLYEDVMQTEKAKEQTSVITELNHEIGFTTISNENVTEESIQYSDIQKQTLMTSDEKTITTTTVTVKKTSAVTTTTTETTSELMSPIFMSGQDGHANIVNGGYACTDAYAYYFSDASGLYRMDGERNTRTLMTNRAFYLNIVQDTLFFVNADRNNALCAIKTDGTGYQVLLDEYCYELTYYEGWLYFNRMTNSSNAICRIRPDGTGFTVLMGCYEWYMSISEDTIYFCNYDDGYKLYAMNTDGTNQRVIYNGECSDICIAENKIYFSSDRTSRKLCSMNLDGTGFQQLTTAYAKHINYYNGKIYFVSDDSKLYACNPDGNNITKYADETITYPIFTPGIVFYEDAAGYISIITT